MSELNFNLLDDDCLKCEFVERDRRLKEAEHLAKLGHWDLDVKKGTLVWSDEIYRIFNTTPQSFKPTYEAFLDYIHPEDRDKIDQAYKKSLKEKIPYGPITHRIQLQNGEIKYVEERGTNEYDLNGIPLRSFGIVQDVTDRVESATIKAKLLEKEVLLKEVYHRVKNNLQLVSSLIRLQANRIEDEEVKQLFIKSQNRVESISMLHEHLLNSENHSSVNIRTYIDELVKNYKQTLPTYNALDFIVDVVDVEISMEKAVPLGLIINEAISNSVKHAFSYDEVGKVVISLRRKGNGCVLDVEDNGKGIDLDVKSKSKDKSFGMDIIKSLTRQLDGKLQIQSDVEKGVKFHFNFNHF